MRAYILRRCLQAGGLALALSFVLFALLSLMPGDPLDLMISANPRFTSADRARLQAIYGLDQPLAKRYARWLTTVARGDLGYSRTYHVPVTAMLGPRLVNTLLLSGGALLLAIIVALPLGVLAALRRGTWADRALNLGAFAGISLPAFFLGLLLILVFAVWLRWLPASGTESVGAADWSWPARLADRARYLALPLVTLAFLQAAVFLRYTRAAMLETLRQDYIRTARAKGLAPATIVVRHALRNALIPVVTVVAMDAGMLFSGAVITETIFAYQGMGKLIYDAVMGNDYNVAMIALLLTVLLVLAANLLADLLYAWLDPRISYQ